ncbi:MAG: glutathione ABC transporter substrate-binding protein [Chloroflexota bacterium]|nr:glutathione ABC transporter substrate-binding protein [Chloroflexota bacterium]
MIRRHRVWIILLLVVALLGLAACGGADEEGAAETGGAAVEVEEEAEAEGEVEVVEEEAEVEEEAAVAGEGGTLTYAAQADVVGFSPILTNDSVSSAANSQIYETLVRRNPETNEIEPLLAESWENPDDRTWLFHLREGVQFQDGTEFTADAVKFTFERMMDPEGAAPRASLLEPVDSIEVVDDYTVQITTKEPYGAFLAAMTHPNAAIVSPAAVEEFGDLMENPVGTGPFILADRTPGESFTLARNPDYWGDPPALDEVVYRVVPELSTQVALLETGEVDFIDTVPPEQIARLQSIPEVEVNLIEGTPITYLGFNHQRELWQDPLVRQAVAHAINQEDIIAATEPLAYASRGIIGPQVFGYSEAIEDEGYPYDPDQARALLEEAGHPEGIEAELWTPDTGQYPRIAQVVQEQLRQAGIDAEIRTLEWGAYLEATANYEHDLFLLGWSNVTADGSEMLYPNLHSANIGASNRSAYNNPEADEMIVATRETVDQEERLGLLHEANVYLVNDVAMVPLSHTVIPIAVRDAVQGLQVAPNGSWYMAPVAIAE